MQVLFVSAECAPLIKTGGLADVTGALPKALAASGSDVRVLLPAYPGLADRLADRAEVTEYDDLFGGPVRVVAGTAEGLSLLLLDAPHLFARPGNPYLGPDGRDWPDNHLRFGGLCRAAADIAAGRIAGWVPDLVHCHDWHAGLVPAYLRMREGGGPPSVMTIHNIAFQGLFAASTLTDLGLSPAGFKPNGFEYYGQLSMLKAGLVYADWLTTVSPTYARELLTPEFGMGMEGVLRVRESETSGILNGIDIEVWNPETDGAIARTYSSAHLRGKAANKAALAAAMGIVYRPDAPLFCVVSRLTRQKGLDLLLDALPALSRLQASLVVLGTGDPDLEAGFEAARVDMPERIGARIGYDEALSHLMQAGADAILVPSRFEPCGLTQLCGLRYGTLPVVTRTGGLADTIIDANDAAIRAGAATGFQFAPASAASLSHAVTRACGTFQQRRLWRRMQRRAMAHPVDWAESAASYATLYARLCTQPARDAPA